MRLLRINLLGLIYLIAGVLVAGRTTTSETSTASG